MNNLSKVLVALLLITCFIFASVSFAKEFPDMPNTHWAYKYVEDLTNKGIVNGYEDGTFKPEGNVTKAEFMKLIMVAEYGEEVFTKVKNTTGTWYEPYFYIADTAGYMTYDVNRITATEPITRKEMAEILSMLAVKHGLVKNELPNNGKDEIILEDGDVDEYASGGKKSKDYKMFKDLDDLKSNEKEFIDNTAKAGFIKGYEDNTFRPSNNMTRAEVSTIIYRFLELTKEG